MRLQLQESLKVFLGLVVPHIHLYKRAKTTPNALDTEMERKQVSKQTQFGPQRDTGHYLQTSPGHLPLLTQRCPQSGLDLLTTSDSCRKSCPAG